MVNERSVSSRHLRIYCIGYSDGNEKSTTIAPLVYVLDVSRNGTMLRGSKDDDARHLKNDRRAVLLNDKDQLHISASTSFLFTQCRDEDMESRSEGDGVPSDEEDLLIAPGRELDMLDTGYMISDRLLGNGTYGKVYMAYHCVSKSQVACKIVAVVEKCRSMVFVFQRPV